MNAVADLTGCRCGDRCVGGNAFEITVARLAQAIRLGLVVVGERLPAERELAERLQVSRVTLREAIPPCARPATWSRGGVGRAARSSPVPGRPGTRTPTPAGRTGPATPAALAREMGDGHLHDALDFRRVLEPGAAALAASRRCPRRDRPTWSACLTASRDRDPATRRVNDSRLHLAIAVASGSKSWRPQSPTSSCAGPAAGRDPGASGATSTTPTPSTPASSTRSSPATRTPPAPPWRSTATEPPAAGLLRASHLGLGFIPCW